MRLRTFTGRTTMEAIGQVRTHLGPSAVIVSTQEDGNGTARVTAALDDNDFVLESEAQAPESVSGMARAIGDALSFHGLSRDLSDVILQACLAQEEQTPLEALAAALASLYRFAPLAQNGKRAIILIGPQGGGKTATAAKLAARAVLAGERVHLITTDMARAGAVAQLEAFAKILRTPFDAVDGPSQLAAALAKADPGERVIIDTGGVNPFNTGDRGELDALLGGCNAEPVLVFPAGGETNDTVAMAEIFRDLGCARVVVSRLDTVRRLGSVMAVANSFSLGLAEAGIAPDIADGLVPFAPMLLARLLLPKGAS